MWTRWTRFCACMLTAVVAAWAANSTFRITTLSNRPDKVSGGDVLVRIDVPENLSVEQTVVKVNGQDITSVFRPDLGERALIGLVAGLRLGENRLEVLAGSQAEGP